MGNCHSSSYAVDVREPVSIDNEKSALWNETKLFSLDSFVDLVMETPGGLSEVVRKAYEEKEEIEQEDVALEKEEDQHKYLHLGKVIEFNKGGDDESFNSTISEGSTELGLSQIPSTSQIKIHISDGTV